jgi:putative spermidine/putrescine transport system permease protein
MRSNADDAPYGVLAVPALAYLLLVFVVPVALLVVGSIVVDQRLTLANFTAYLGDSHNLRTVEATLRYAFLSAAFCLVLGYPFARLMLGLTQRAELLVFAALLLPMSLSLIVRAFGWTILLGRDGPLNHLLLGLHVVDRPIRLLFTETGLVLGTISIKLPLMILPIFLALKTIPSELHDAGAALGAGPLYRFARIELPLALPGILAGFALVFAQAAAAYVLPTLLGGARMQIMSNAIVDSFLILQQGAVGSTISVLLLAIVTAVLVLTSALASRRVHA